MYVNRVHQDGTLINNKTVIWHTDGAKGVENLINVRRSSVNIFFRVKHLLGA